MKKKRFKAKILHRNIDKSPACLVQIQLVEMHMQISTAAAIPKSDNILAMPKGKKVTNLHILLFI